jgi:hypothetical protein
MRGPGAVVPPPPTHTHTPRTPCLSWGFYFLFSNCVFYATLKSEGKVQVYSAAGYEFHPWLQRIQSGVNKSESKANLVSVTEDFILHFITVCINRI